MASSSSPSCNFIRTDHECQALSRQASTSAKALVHFRYENSGVGNSPGHKSGKEDECIVGLENLLKGIDFDSMPD